VSRLEQSRFDLAVDAFGGYEKFLDWLREQDPQKALELGYDWGFLARPKQLPPPGHWSTWSLRAGRGFGKTRCGAETVRLLVEGGHYGNGALVASTAADARDVMVEGPSGILAISPPWFMPIYEPSKRRLTWPNGATATLFSAEEPDRLRGPNKDYAWCLEGGTLVKMADGSDKPIEHVEVGDRVMTRLGARTVSASQLTRRDAELVEMTAANGSILTGTANHRILANGKFTPLGEVRAGDILWTWQAKSCVSTEISSTTTERTTTETPSDNFYSESFGNSIAGKFHPNSSSTTSTRTSSTIESKTSRRCLGVSICVDTGLMGGLRGQRSDEEKSSGLAGEGASHHEETANTAEDSTSRSAPTADGAGRSAGWQRDTTVLRVRRLRRRADVYDITVECAGEFFANGILVHNCDEIAAWQRLQETWDMLQFTLRLGPSPKCVVTSTPRGLKFLRDLEKDKTTVVTIGSMYENQHNLAPPFLKKIKEKYEGTRLGRQEIGAEILDDNPGALWKQGQIDLKRLTIAEFASLGDVVNRIVVALDPATTSTSGSDENGIICVGAGMCSCNGKPALHGFVFEDASDILTPNETCLRVLEVYERRFANSVVGETNQGGDWIESLLRSHDKTKSLKYTGVHAKDGKRLRADPVSALYEQQRVHHVGALPKLEDEQTQWDPSVTLESPNRVDALVHGLTALMVKPPPASYEARTPGRGHQMRR
jgi:phage terminase large subunit-like protein